MGDNSSSSVAKEEKWIKHYSNFQKILLVGEGDFSFSVSLANAFGSASNMVATSLDSEDEVKAKYSKGETNLKVLKEMGCTIFHQINVHNMSSDVLLLNHGPFDRIVFNFPHATLILQEHSILQIRLHQELVSGFMRNAREMLSIKGEVHVTHKTAHPFSNWRIETLAEEVGLHTLIGKDRFNIWEYRGYENRRGYKKGISRFIDESFPVGECYTFKFAL